MKFVLLLVLAIASTGLVGCIETTPQGRTTRYLPFTESRFQKGGTIAICGNAFSEGRYPMEHEKAEAALISQEFAKKGYSTIENPRVADYVVMCFDQHTMQQGGYSGRIRDYGNSSSLSISPNYFMVHKLQIGLYEMERKNVGKMMWKGDASMVTDSRATHPYNLRLIKVLMARFPGSGEF